MKIKYKLLCVVFLTFFVVANAQFVKRHGQLKVVGTQLMDANDDPVVLRGLSFGWHSFHPRFYNKKVVKWLKKDFKCNVVRAAMGIEIGDLTYKNDSVFAIKKIKAVVDAAIQQDIYVIIDWHSHNINLTEAKAFFAQMSKEYGKYPNVIYEVFNEPDYETWPEVKAYAEEVIKVIRKNDADNIILVGSPRWDQDVHLPAADPIIGYDNLMYTMHFYAGTHEKWLRDKTDEAIEKGLPIFVSESAGMEATGDGPLNFVAWEEYINWMESKKLSWITWSISDKDESCSILNKSAKSNGIWKDKDLKESGLKIREYLRKYNKEE